MSNTKPETTYTVTVPEDKSAIRLDKLLAGALPEFSRTRLKGLIGEGCVFLQSDGVPITDPAYGSKEGDVYSVTVPEARSCTPLAQDIPLTVIFEDDQLIVIDKPAGLVVHPGAGNPDGTLVNALLAHCGDSLSGIGGVRRPGIVHRLDKDTSGLMVAAKTDAAHRFLAGQFSDHSLDRAYSALLWGVPHPRHGEVAGNMGRSRRNRKKMAILASGGKSSLTNYRTVKSYGEAASRVECRLATGRTHQIRVHMASLGCPVIGDPLYGGGRRRKKAMPPEARAALDVFPRQALHAFLIGFVHPVSLKRLRFESETPDDIKKIQGLLESL